MESPRAMNSERSRSAAVLCRSGWERDANERGVWSRTGVRESRAREDSRTPGRCRAHPRSRRPEEADPPNRWKAPERWTPNGPGVRQSSAALAGNTMRKNTAFDPAPRFASRERERTRALQDAAALIPVAADGRMRIARDRWKAPERWTPNGPGVRQSTAALAGNGMQMNAVVGPPPRFARRERDH
jgi:hypothetical protein